MRDRLLQIMQEKGLTSSKIAELLGVRPSAISHILSGRNNPSYDFIVKLLDIFPDVDPRYLLTGKMSDEYLQGSDRILNAQQLNSESDNESSLGVMIGSYNLNLEPKDKQTTIPKSLPETNPIASKSDAGFSEATPEHIFVMYPDGTFKDYKYRK